MITARLPVLLALGLSVALGVAAWHWRTGAVGGSDSSCYALMTRAYSEGRWQPESALAGEAPWPDPTRVAAPGGFLPSSTVPGAAVPVCAPGYSLLVTPLVVVAGLEAVHVVPPLAAAALVWLAFVLGRRLHSPWAGAGASALVATSPIVLFQAVQPMNDITTAAVWVGVAAALVSRRVVVMGLLIGLGLLVRPNLAPAAVAAVLACAALVATAAAPGRRIGAAIGAMTVASIAAVPGLATALALNASLYGSPFQSGYGDLGVLFAWAHVPANLARYGHTWWTTSTPLVAVSLLAPWVVRPAQRPAAWAAIVLVAGLSVVYLAYLPFPEWWYLRFLLPAVVLLLVLTAVALAALAGRIGGAAAAAVAAVIVVAVSGAQASRPESREARGLARLEARFVTTATLVAERLPASAVLVTGWESGAIRFTSGHEVVMWDALDPAWLDRAVDWLEEHGRAPVFVLESWEQDGFRSRFAGQRFGALDWPPRYDVGRRVLVFVPQDRARFQEGDPVATQPVFDRRRRP